MTEKLSIFGMQLDLEDDSQFHSCQPLCGFVVIKALDDEGRVVYLAAATEGLKSVECLGMARYAIIRLEHGLMRELDDGDDDERP